MAAKGETGVVVGMSDNDDKFVVLLDDTTTVTVDRRDLAPDVVMSGIAKNPTGLRTDSRDRKAFQESSIFKSRLDRSYTDSTIGAPFHGTF